MSTTQQAAWTCPEPAKRPTPDASPASASCGEFPLSSLLSGAREGDRQCMGELLQHYRNYLLVLATTQIERRLQPRVSPSDIVQETMLKAHRHFGQFQGQSEGELLAWLRQILATSLARFVEQYMLAAKRDIRREISLDHGAPAEEASPRPLESLLRAAGESPSAAAQHREEALMLADRLDRLPPVYREILVLRNLQGLSFEEAAARLDRSPGAARMLWLRAIEKLRAVYRRADPHDS